MDVFDIETLATALRETKEERVADDASDNNLFGAMYFWRDNRPLAMLATQQSRDLYLLLARLLVPAFNASGLMICLEHFARQEGKHPSGRDWKKGEFQEMVEAGRAEEFGIIESIAVWRFTRNPGMGGGRGCQGDQLAQSFTIKGKTVEWGTPEKNKMMNTGVVGRGMNEIFERDAIPFEDPKRTASVKPEHLPYLRLHADLSALEVAVNLVGGDKVQGGCFANGDDPVEMETVARWMDKFGTGANLINLMAKFKNASRCRSHR